jgi:hypothetical protein
MQQVSKLRVMFAPFFYQLNSQQCTLLHPTCWSKVSVMKCVKTSVSTLEPPSLSLVCRPASETAMWLYIPALPSLERTPGIKLDPHNQISKLLLRPL